MANYDEIERLDLAIGDSVWLVKANDIIPQIIRVTERPPTRQAILAPTVCPFCGGEVGRRRISSGDEGDLYSLRDRAEELANLVTHAERELRLGEKRATSILNAIDASRTLTLNKLLANGVTVLPTERNRQASDIPATQTVCVSGKLPSGSKKADYEQPLREAGYKLVDDVTKGQGFLVLADPDFSSSKAVKARKLGVEVISEERLKELIDGDNLVPLRDDTPISDKDETP